MSTMSTTRGSRRQSRYISLQVVLGILMVYFLVPFWWVVVNSSKTAGGLFGGGNALLLAIFVVAMRRGWPTRTLLGVALFVGGGVSNLLDRISHESVIDFMNVVGGQPTTLISLSTTQVPTMATPIGAFLYLASAIKAEVDLPIFHATRIADVASANRAVAEGHVDMVAMTRAHIADPHIARKLMEDRP